MYGDAGLGPWRFQGFWGRTESFNGFRTLRQGYCTKGKVRSLSPEPGKPQFHVSPLTSDLQCPCAVVKRNGQDAD